MSLPSKYFERRNAEANDTHLEMAGWQNADDMDADGDEFGADAFESFEGQESLGAAGGSRKKSQSQPYVIEIENTTTNDIANVVFLDAANTGSNKTSGVKYTYGLDNLNYDQFLTSINGGLVFKVGQTRLVAYNSTNSATAEIQVLERLKCQTVDPNNNLVSRTFIPQYDNYQQIKSQTDVWDEYSVNGLTSLKFTTLYAKTKITVYLYPVAKVSDLKQLKTGATTKYGNPGINPSLRKR